ncbi:hypothetical protein THII_0013 [Thioploca ingrica]|uniref:Calx-beta domain-containing protein n=1 Tax=Thioploca ingrica TaxID=40754 RepID=A0A090AHU7_9GAMM|nr:hypothetical protein THII_0013 [Thioploca ingrica]
MLRLNSKFHLLVTPLFTILLTNSGIASADAGTLQFSQATFNVHENDKTATIEVTRSGGSDGKVSVKCTTSDGTATAGSDYQAIPGKLLKWADGDTAPKTCNVKIINDKVFNEGYETANLTLSDPTGGAVLGTSDATLRIADDDCGLGDHWVDICSSGIDDSPSHATIGIAFGTDCQDKPGGVHLIKLSGPTIILRGDPVDAIKDHPQLPNVGEFDGHNDVIETEMVFLELSGDSPLGPITVRAGDGIGNLNNDNSLYSPGAIHERNSINPNYGIREADSFFNVWFEMDTPLGTLYNKVPFLMESIGIPKVPPTPTKIVDPFGKTITIVPTYLHPFSTVVGSGRVTLPLYKKGSDELVACFKEEEENWIKGIPTSTHLSVTLASFSAEVINQQVNITWETGTEENNAAFRVSRGIPLTGICSANPNDYTEITQVTPLIPSKATEMSGAIYSITDSNVISGTTYCYVLEDIDYNNKSTFHTDQLVSVTVN